MADGSKIEWTDATWNPITGCSIASPACAHCYAMRLAGTRMRHHWSRQGLTQDSKAGPVWNGQVRFNEEWLAEPLRWQRPRRIFVCAHGDLFHEAVPDEWIDRVFAVMALAPQHTFQVLTKRAERMHRYMTDPATPARIDRAMNEIAPAHWCARELEDYGGWPLPAVWLGVSAEDQPRADERRAPLAALAACGWITFVSYEPALGLVDWTGWEFLALLISGGESGPQARPSHADWYRAARDFCLPRRIAYFHKQNGEWTSGENVQQRTGVVAAAWFDDGRWIFGRENLANEDGHIDDEPDVYRVGKRAAGRLLDGVVHDGMPR